MLGSVLFAIALVQSGPKATVERLYAADEASADALLAPELRAWAAGCPGWIDRVRPGAPGAVTVNELNRSGRDQSVVLARYAANGETYYRRFTLSLRDGDWLIDDAVAATGQPTLRDHLADCASGGGGA